MRENKVEQSDNESISLTIASLIAFFIFGILLIVFYAREDNVLLAFGGSIVGACLSGCISFVVMYHTNKAGKENVERTIESNEKMCDIERKLSIRPYIWVESIIYDCKKLDMRAIFCTEKCPEANIRKSMEDCFEMQGDIGNYVHGIMVFKNIGLGTAIDFKITRICSAVNQNEQMLVKVRTTDNIVLGVDKTISCSLGIYDTWEEYEENREQDVNLLVEYKDLLGNQYEQKILLELYNGTIIFKSSSIPEDIAIQ